MKIRLDFPRTGSVRKLLHVGCNYADPLKLPSIFRTVHWKEVRFDIDPNVEPDIIGSVTNMDKVAVDSFDAVFSSHTFEHLYTHEVPIALRECLRVLVPAGCLVLRVPNLARAAEIMLKKGLYSVAYRAKSGPVRPIDIIFGNTGTIRHGNHFFAHRTGFTPKALEVLMKSAGFHKVQIDLGKFDIYGVGWKPST